MCRGGVLRKGVAFVVGVGLSGVILASLLGRLYPAGEGAGFAGGIVSAAVDGLRVAQALNEAFVAE